MNNKHWEERTLKKLSEPRGLAERIARIEAFLEMMFENGTCQLMQNRVRVLEQWRYYMSGGLAVVLVAFGWVMYYMLR